MHKNKYNKLCKTNEKITIEWKMIDEKTKKTYIWFNETIRNKRDKRKRYDEKRTGSISNRNSLLVHAEILRLSDRIYHRTEGYHKKENSKYPI